MNKTTRIILSVVMLALVIGAGIWYYQKADEISVLNLPYSGEVKPSDWETYRSEQYGFEVKYPARFEFTEETVADVPYYQVSPNNSVHFTKDEGKPTFEGLGNIFISREPIEQVINATTSLEGRQYSLFKNVKKIEFNGHTAYEGWENYEMFENYPQYKAIKSYNYILVVNNNGYTFEISSGFNFREKKSLTDEQKQFIASFKFTK